MPAGYRFSTRLLARCTRGTVEYATGELGDGGIVRVWPGDGTCEHVEVAPADPYAAQASYFLDRLDDAPALTEGNAEQGYAAVAVASAALRSASSGTAEKIELRRTPSSAVEHKSVEQDIVKQKAVEQKTP